MGYLYPVPVPTGDRRKARHPRCIPQVSFQGSSHSVGCKALYFTLPSRLEHRLKYIPVYLYLNAVYLQILVFYLCSTLLISPPCTIPWSLIKINSK